MYAPQQLGFLEVIDTGVGVLQDVGSILGLGSDDAKRFQAIDRRKALALAGDMGSLYVLKCWSGQPTPELHQFPELARDVGVNATGTNCGMATAAAKARARAAYEEVLAARSGGPRPVGSSTYPLTMTTTAGGGVSPLVVGGLALVAVLMLSRRRR